MKKDAERRIDELMHFAASLGVFNAEELAEYADPEEEQEDSDGEEADCAAKAPAATAPRRQRLRRA